MVIFCFLLFVILFPNFSQAGEPLPAETLPPMVVTATRTEVPLNQLTTSLTVITNEEIRERQAELVSEVLRDVAGVNVVQTGSMGTATSVFIRGSASNQVLVLIDGVEINSTTTGAYDFANLTTESIERIEVLRGAGGTLYGSQAIGGVINIITKRGQGPLDVGVSAQGGNAYTNRQVATLRGGIGDLGYSFSVARLASDGFRSVNDDYRNLSTSARLDYQVTENASLKGIFHFIKSDGGLYNNNNFASQPDPNARQATTQYVTKLEWDQKIFRNWDYRISGSMFKENDKFSDDVDACVSFGDPCDFSPTTDRFRPLITTGEFQTNYRFEDWGTTTFGTQYNRRSARTSGGINEAVRNIGYYLQQQFQFFDRRLIAIPGIRLDDNQEFGSAWTPSFSAAYLFKEIGTKLKGGYAKGFRAPNLNELFFPPAFGCPAFGNPNLGPERSWEINFGVEQNLLAERIKIGGNYFHREVKDLIEPSPIPGNPRCLRAENVGRARFDGVELTLGIKIFEGLTLNANYTYLDWDTADGNLRRRPHNSGNVILNYLQDALNINLIVNIVGRRDDLDAVSFADTVTAGYGTVDLASSYRLPWRMPLVKELSLIGKIQNLFNKKYDQADGFRAPPLNFLLGFRANFGNQ
jgi:vitamin B12 transporter